LLFAGKQLVFFTDKSMYLHQNIDVSTCVGIQRVRDETQHRRVLVISVGLEWTYKGAGQVDHGSHYCR